MRRLKRRVYEILEAAENGDRVSRIVDVALVSLICANIAALILDSVDVIHAAAPRAFFVFEAVSTGIFTVEYVLRVWCCTENPRYSHPITGRVKLVFSPIQMMDLAAILPFYLVFPGG